MFVIVLIILFIILLIFQGYDFSKITTLIGIYLLAIIKIIPSINKAVTAANYLQYATKSLSTLNNEINFNFKENKINESQLSKNEIYFNKEIKLTNILFKYSEKIILNNINLELKKIIL